MDVAEWLGAIGLERYAAAFRENDVDAALLHQLTADDLKELGVATVGHRRRMLAAIAELQGGAVEQPSTGPPTEGQPSTAAAERRHLTVLFCDIVGSTPLSARLDPEELREILTAYQVAVAAEVAGKRGHIARFVGDGVLAYFGWPNADEAHAESAVRAGLAILAAVGRQQLPVRIGIATGLVVVGDLVGVGAVQTVTAVGETPNLAARLQTLAEPNTIVVSDATRLQLGQMFELEALGPTALKGFDRPVLTWRVKRATAAASRSETVYASALIPLVGRDEELDLLMRRWRQAKAGEGRVILISGEPGIGKSRLLAALEERLAHEPHISLRYFCSPHHQDSPLYPIAARMEQEAGFARGDTEAASMAELASMVAPTAPAHDGLELLATLRSIPSDQFHAGPDEGPRRWKEQTFAALTRRLTSLAHQAPVLMVFEDAHWSDPTSIELLDTVIKQVPELPVLLIVSSRPNFTAPWFGRPGVSFMALSRLGQRDAALLAARINSDSRLSEPLLDQIVTRADGIPLFIEELTKAVLEVPECDTATSALAVPATLQASLTARLDRLHGGRELAQIGAVIGREFSYDMLSDVAGLPPSSLETSLAELVRSELVFQTGTPPDARYAFKHMLVQQAAYETLLRSRRQGLHARIAKALLERLPDEAERRWHLLLHHATLADDHGLAARACIEAGERSLLIFAHEEAYRLAQRGLTHLDSLPDGEQKARSRAKLLVIKVHAAYKHGEEGPDLVNHLQEAAETAARLGLHNEAVAVLHALSWLKQWSNDATGASQTALMAEEVSRRADQFTRCHQTANTGRCLLEVEQQIPRALAMIDEAETMAKTLDVDFVELEWARAHAARWKGDLDRAHTLMSRAVELARLRAERWREVECLIWLAMIDLERQKLLSVEQYCSEIDEIARHLDHTLPPVTAVFRGLAQGSRTTDVSPMFDQALGSLREYDDKAHLAYALNFTAHEALAKDQHSQARTAATEALAAAQAMSRTTEIIVATSILARAECADGDRTAAIARLRAAAGTLDFEILSARARTNLEAAALDIGCTLDRPSEAGQSVGFHEN
ncbi:MAG TPA: AAA family ATPase [Rhodopila sp.]|jgi:class 3 adenylate cyclase